MPSTYILIASNTLSSAAASVTFSSIPSTYTDLELLYTVRSTVSGINQLNPLIRFNGVSTATYGGTYLNSYLNAVGTTRLSSQSGFDITRTGMASDGNTANTFSTGSIYIPNYTVSRNKCFTSNQFSENNTSTGGTIDAVAGLWSNTAAISSIVITPNALNFAAGSSFFLYGIKNN